MVDLTYFPSAVSIYLLIQIAYLYENNFFSDSTLDRTSQWVAASRESLNHLTGPALPPKPSIIPTHGIHIRQYS